MAIASTTRAANRPSELVRSRPTNAETDPRSHWRDRGQLGVHQVLLPGSRTMPLRSRTSRQT